jgi:PAS domain S-box-containing protein
LISKALKNAIDSIGDAIVVQGLDYKVIYENEALRNRYGVHTGELCYEVFENEKDICKNCPMVLSLEDGGIHKDERRIVIDKGVQHFELTTSPLRNESGEIIAGIKVVRDITERKEWEGSVLEVKDMLEALVEERTKKLQKKVREHKKAQKSLTESEQFNREIISNVREGFIAYDREFRYLVWNKFMEELTGYPAEEVLGRNALDIFPHIREWGIDELFKRALSGEVCTTSNVPIKEPGTEKEGWAIGMYAPHYNSAGEIVGVIATVRDVTEQIKAGEALRDSEELFRTIVENSQPIVFMIDKERKFLLSEGKMLSVLGLKPGQVVGQSALELYKEFPAIIQGINKALSGDTHKDIIEVNGLYFDIFYSPYKDSKGHVLGVIGMAVDITERVQAEDKIRKSEEKYRSIFESIQDVYAEVAVDGTILEISPSIEMVCGYKRVDMIGRSMQEFYVYPEQRNELIDKLSRYGMVNDYEVILRDSHGNEVPCSFSAKLVADANGNPVKTVGTMRDVAERKKAEERAASLGRIFETSRNEIYIFDAETLKFIQVNRGARENLGYSMEELCEMTPLDLKPEYTPERFEDLIAPLCSGKQDIIQFNTVHRRKDESLYPVEVYLQRSTHEHIPVFVAIILDITDRKKAEEERSNLEAQLLQSQKIEAVGRLAGGIAHDFNNILSAIIANSSLINLNLKEDDQNREYVDQILSLSERATSLTKGLLAFSRKQIIALKPIRVNDVISSSEKILSRLIGEDIELSVKLSNDDLVIMADSVQMEQVLMNLVTNARDAMPDGGVLTIKTDSMEMDNEYIEAQGYGEPGAYAAISITDSGFGMNEETKDRIFEPFFTSKDLGRGTGLGLSTIYGIVKQLNGYINVESELGRGTSFKIYFPLTDRKVVDTKREDYAITIESCTETILLAEDEEPVRKSLKAILETFGYTVIVAVDGEDAVDQFIKHKDDIDLLLFDVIMPNMSGKEAYDEIKKIRPDIKAIFASGYTEDVIHKKGVLEEGINFMYKPATPGQLFREIKRVLRS